MSRTISFITSHLVDCVLCCTIAEMANWAQRDARVLMGACTVLLSLGMGTMGVMETLGTPESVYGLAMGKIGTLGAPDSIYR